MPTLWKRMCCAALLLAALAALGACGTHETPVMDENALRQALVGKTWTLRRIVSRDFADDPARTIKFNADGTVEGFGGCNAFTGTYTLTDDYLEFGTLTTSAHKSCGPAEDEREYTYMTYLATVRRINTQTDPGELILLTESQSEMRFTSGASEGLFW
ncbi:META domain protein [Pseudodesulfovibrio hydrargyri]|uniref:META domain protein n=1 Tax=Pseudodesulfovibrio hydrargyri TaxID=2125990 RepID=A0A1J5MWV3_9BACT|nr:META domain-containing protein [Pseudodesulfovibrio hydrargyri]OIQ51053.1 META domain protein [Pseudodesulfovibrio hydrargyri]